MASQSPGVVLKREVGPLRLSGQPVANRSEKMKVCCFPRLLLCLDRLRGRPVQNRATRHCEAPLTWFSFLSPTQHATFESFFLQKMKMSCTIYWKILNVVTIS